MKTLTVFALLCAMMALTTAAALSEVKDEHGTVEVIQEGEHHVIERSTSCPGGWNLINGRCFLYVPRSMSWARAELNCQSMGANLASVHLAEEYHEHYWFWSDGTSFNYRRWCHGEPNNGGGAGQHCIQMNYSGGRCWNDLQCSDKLPSVCARKR
ncbi:ladderlectin-like [Epinephelus moara]|uniref:ladderlectin-like n=1 Tax=Epinephelus moara TaxID=300413 RepID=UPI00214EF44B|nr:ladderlectin-like [Epinephelus moara]